MEKLVHPDVSFSYPVAPKDKISKPRSVDFVSQWRSEILDNPYLNYNSWMESLSLDNKQGIISVYESADILSRLSLKSFEAPYKIVIIWLPERMNDEAANKLLKIIEEPPDDTLFFLVAETRGLAGSRQDHGKLRHGAPHSDGLPSFMIVNAPAMLPVSDDSPQALGRTPVPHPGLAR